MTDDNKNLQDFISLSEASKSTGYHQDYLGFLCRQGKLKGFKIGRNWVITKSDLDEFLKTYKNGINEVVDESGNKIRVHVLKQESNLQIPNLAESDFVPASENLEVKKGVFELEASNKLNNLKVDVLKGLDARVEKISSTVANLENEINKIEIPVSNKFPDQLRYPINLKNNFSSNYPISSVDIPSSDPDSLNFDTTSALSKINIQKLYSSFTKFAPSNLSAILFASVIALTGLAGSWFIFSYFDFYGNEVSPIVYFPKGKESFNSRQGLQTSSSSPAVYFTKTETKVISQVLGFDQTKLYSLIDARLNKYLSEGKFIGPKGEAGIQGPQGSVGSNSAPISYYSSSYGSGSIFAATDLSAERAIFKNLNVTGGATLSSLTTSNLNLGFAQGGVVFQGTSGLAQDTLNYFYNASTTQLAIGTSTPNASAILELDSTSKGFLAPRMTVTERNAIVSPATGLLIFNTDDNQYNFYNGTSWLAVGSGGGGNGSVATGTLNSFAYYSSVNQLSPQNILFINGNRIGIGSTSPTALLTVQATGSPTNLFQISSTTGDVLLTVSNSGNLGLGVVNPAERLTVLNNTWLGFTNSSGSTAYKTLTVDAGNDLYLQYPESQSLFVRTTDGVTRLRVDAGGNIAVGKNSASARLDVVGTSMLFGSDNISNASRTDATIKQFQLLAPHYLNSQNPVFALGVNNDSVSNQLLIGGGLTASANALNTIAFYTSTSTTGGVGLERMRIDLNGNVGIGSTTPTQKLVVAGNAYVTGFQGVGVGATASVSGEALRVRGDILLDSQATAATLTLSSATTTGGYGELNFGFQTLPGGPFIRGFGSDDFLVLGTGQAERIRINSSGNVAIGTTTPSARLSVTGTNSIDPFNISSTSGASILRVTQAGNVGIGSSAPSSLLTLKTALLGTDQTNIFTLTDGGNVLRTALRASGIQQWWLNSGSGEVGSIAYTTPTGIPGISISGTDTNNRALILNQSSILTLGVSSSGGTPQQVFLNTLGNLGIGTSTPSQKLVVSGDARITGALFDSSNASGTLGMVLQTTGTGTQWVATSTLGISSSLSGGVGGYVARWTSASGLSTGTLIDNGTVAGVNATSSTINFLVQGTGSNNPFQINSSTGTALLTVLANGNVGIGTSTPNAVLTLRGTGQDLISIEASDGVRDFVIQDNNRAALFVGQGNTLPANYGLTIGAGALGVPRSSGLVFGSYTAGAWTPRAAIISDSSNNLMFYQGNTVEAMRIMTTTGNLGIGTTTADQKLVVAGDARITGALFDSNNASGTSGMILQSTGTGTQWVATSSIAASLGAFVQGGNSFSATATLGTIDNNSLNFVTNSSTRLTITSAGDVGIGITNPTTPLDVVGNINTSGQVIANSHITLQNSSASFRLRAGNTLLNSSAAGILQVSNASGGANGTLLASVIGLNSTTPNSVLLVQGTSTSPTMPVLTVASSSGANLLTVLPNGNVGIGTATPGTLLQLANSASYALRLSDGSGNNKVTLGYSGSDNAGFIEGYNGSSVRTVLIRAAINSNVQGWFSSGLFGIGTSSPAAQLHIQSFPINNAITLIVQASSSQTSNLTQWRSGSNSVLSHVDISGNFGIGTTTTQTRLSVTGSSTVDPFNISSTSGSSILRVVQDGNVGINTTTPTQKLVVAGDVRITGALFDTNNASGTQGMVLQTTGTGTQWVATSSLVTSLGTFVQGGNSFGATALFGTNDNNPVNIETNGIVRATFDTNGRLGIGTTSPIATLTVMGTSSAPTINPFVVASSSGTQLFTITPSGNVGIGTANPTNPLDVFGRIQLNTNGSGNGLAFGNALVQIYRDSGANMIMQTFTDYVFTTNSSSFERMRITQAGNIGIGTSTPSQQLVVAGNARIAGALFDSSNASGTIGMILQTTGTGTQWVATSSLGIGGSLSGGTNGLVARWTSASTLGTGTLIDSGTVAGINATSSTVNFLVQGTDSNSSFQVNSSTGTTMLKLDALGQLTLGSSANSGHKLYNNGSMRVDGTIYLAGDSASCYISGLLNSGTYCGSVNGGNMSIYNNFANNFGANGSGLWLSGHGATSGNGISLKDYGYIGINTSTAANTFTIQATSSTNILPLFVVATSTGVSYFQINANGNIGIGTSTPSQQLVVAGNARIAGALFDSSNASGTTGMILQTTGTGTQWVATSSLGISSSLSGGVGGYVARWTSASGLSTGTLMDDGTVAGVNATSSTINFLVQGTGSNNPFQINSSTGTGLVTVLANGNLGVGVTAPTGLLHVQKFLNNVDLLLAQGLNSGFKVNVNGEVVTLSGYGASDELAFGTNSSTERMRINSTGNVGIGTTTPSARVSVTGSSTIDPFDISSTSGTSLLRVTQAGNVGIGTTIPGSTLSVVSASTVASTTPIISVGTSTNGSLLTFNGLGRLGIGNTSPSAAIDINLNNLSSISSGVGLNISRSADVGINVLASGASTRGYINLTGSSSTWWLSSGSSGLQFINNSSINAAVNALMTSTGFGIGTTTISTRLSLTGSPTVDPFNISSTSGSTILRVTQAGNVGIGTTSPQTMLHVGSVANPGSVTIAKGYLCVDDNDTCSAANADGGIYSVTAATTGADVAENYPTYDIGIKPGDVVVADNSSPVHVVKASSTSSKILGVVSTKPGVLLNGYKAETFGAATLTPVALSGRVPVKVSNENGNIKIGDYLVASKKFNGYAMKATYSGDVIGVALENFEHAVPNSSGKVLVFMKIGYQVINNTFVLGENDGQIANATSSNGVLQAESFLINQKGSGNILQLQANDENRFLVASSGLVSILAKTVSETDNILTVSNNSTPLFTINAVGKATLSGHIQVGKDTAGTAIIKAGDNKTTVTFNTPYTTTPKVIVTVNGLPDFSYGVIEKTTNGFTIAATKEMAQDISFDWFVIEQPEETGSVSGINILNSDIIVPDPTPTPEVVPIPLNDPIPEGNVLGTSTPQVEPIPTPTPEVTPTPNQSSSETPSGSGQAPTSEVIPAS